MPGAEREVAPEWPVLAAALTRSGVAIARIATVAEVLVALEQATSEVVATAPVGHIRQAIAVAEPTFGPSQATEVEFEPGLLATEQQVAGRRAEREGLDSTLQQLVAEHPLRTA